MIIFYYDKSFKGLLTSVYQSFSIKQIPHKLLSDNEIAPLLTAKTIKIATSDRKATRVYQALKKRLSKISLKQLNFVWLSELPDNDLLIFNYLHKVLANGKATANPLSIETDFSDEVILTVKKIAQKVSKEQHHIIQFVRFNTIKNNHLEHDKGDIVYFAIVSPIYNVLPLTLHYFKERFADQKWAIYDQKRQFGYFYDLQKVQKIQLEGDLICNHKINAAHLSDDEQIFQKMWAKYCQAINIKERYNPKLQKQYMPKRFWNTLPEMNNIVD